MPSGRRLSSATWALRTQFFVSGALFATWGVHVPTVKAHFGLGDQALAWAMLAAGAGALAALVQAGRLVGRLGPRRVALVTGLGCAAAIALLLASGSYAVLIVLMLVYGACASLFDVSINAEASEIERLGGRPVMSGFHALFSLGGMAGAAAGSLLPHTGLTAAQHLWGAGALAAVLVVGACTSMLPMSTAPAPAAPLSLPRGRLALIGVLAALGLITEGAMYDWSVLFIHEERGASASLAAAGYAGFSAAMAAARFGGDWVRARLTPVQLLRASGVLAAAGLLQALVVPQAWAALLGFVLVGLGLANVVPALFSAASQVPGVTPAHGIAAVSSLGYLGMMAGPPLIGVLAERSSLTGALGVVVVFACVLALAARRALPPEVASLSPASAPARSAR
jgi:predicted MFS family arabinose efflux permease